MTGFPSSVNFTDWAWTRELASGEKLVLLALARHADHAGCCYPGQKRLAALTGISERSIRLHLSSLEEGRLITRRHRYRANRRTSDYYVILAGQQLASDEAPLVADDLPEDSAGTVTCVPAESAGTGETPLAAESAGTVAADSAGTGSVPLPAESAGYELLQRDLTTPGEGTSQTRASAREDTHPPTDAPSSAAATPRQEAPAKTSRAERATRIPADLALDDGRRNYAINKGVPAGAVPEMFEHFCNHHAGKGTRMVSWDRAWMTWVQNAPRFGNGRPSGRGSSANPNATVSYQNSTTQTVNAMTADDWRRENR